MQKIKIIITKSKKECRQDIHLPSVIYLSRPLAGIWTNFNCWQTLIEKDTSFVLLLFFYLIAETREVQTLLTVKEGD